MSRRPSSKPLHNFALTLPKPQGDLAAELMKSELKPAPVPARDGARLPVERRAI